MGRKFYSDKHHYKLDESNDYILTCEYEYVFLTNKNTSQEICIDSHNGDPKSGLLVFDDDDKDSHVVIAGFGLSIYNISEKKLVKFWDEPDKVKYPDGLYFPFFADVYQFGFVMDSEKSSGLGVFMGNAKTLDFKELS